jgi:hypothetical protein
MLLFIFSLYKTFYLVPNESNVNQFTDTDINIDTNIVIETGDNILIKDVLLEPQITMDLTGIKDSGTIEDKYGISDIDVINMFYKTINER